jgi:transcriptional regulator with XRE-family HTH domain
MDTVIGDNLKFLRKKAGLSLRELQEKVNISHNTLGAYERHSIEPTITNCYTLCRFYDVPIEYLFLGEDCLRNFQDNELGAMIKQLDILKLEDRELIKKYLRKYLATVSDLEELRKEMK